jgi:hypothetical protein
VFVYGEAGQPPLGDREQLTEVGKRSQLAALSSPTGISASIIALGASSNSDFLTQAREEFKRRQEGKNMWSGADCWSGGMSSRPRGRQMLDLCNPFWAAASDSADLPKLPSCTLILEGIHHSLRSKSLLNQNVETCVDSLQEKSIRTIFKTLSTWAST